MTTYKILTIIAVSMQQSAIVFSMEPNQIPLRQLDIVHQALGKISQGNSAAPVVRIVLKNPTYTGELNQKAQFYGPATEKKVLELILKEKCALLQKDIAELTHYIATK